MDLVCNSDNGPCLGDPLHVSSLAATILQCSGVQCSGVALFVYPLQVCSKQMLTD